MVVGTVLRNDYVAEDDPLRYTIYVGCDSKFVCGVYLHNGKIKRARYPKEDIGEGKKIVPVGFTDTLAAMANLMEQDLAEFASMDE